VSSRAVFLDRDGTIVEDAGYLREASAMRLLPGAEAAIARLNRAGWLAVVVTNQSAIGRGWLTEAEYANTVARLDQLLAGAGARLDAQLHCPHFPEITGPCECRKPGTLLYRRAAEQLDIDLSRSWWVGDRVRDLEAGAVLGGLGTLVLTGAGRTEARRAEERGFLIAADLSAAVERMLAG
jgi:D-glycero-D-manno-heptose 1,7-bisphosphate phosphatase